MSSIKTTPDPIDVAVGQRVRARRRKLQMSQTHLAQALGITFQQVQKYERATNRISASRLVAIAKVLKTSVAVLVGEVEDPSATAHQRAEVQEPRRKAA